MTECQDTGVSTPNSHTRFCPCTYRAKYWASACKLTRIRPDVLVPGASDIRPILMREVAYHESQVHEKPYSIMTKVPFAADSTPRDKGGEPPNSHGTQIASRPIYLTQAAPESPPVSALVHLSIVIEYGGRLCHRTRATPVN